MLKGQMGAQCYISLTKSEIQDELKMVDMNEIMELEYSKYLSIVKSMENVTV